jgi:hypothetical protein
LQKQLAGHLQSLPGHEEEAAKKVPQEKSYVLQKQHHHLKHRIYQ